MDDGLQTQFRGVTDDLPTRVDVASLITPENFERERENIFRRAWMPIGHAEDLPEKGSYFVFDVPTFNTSLIAIRGNDDRIRVFHNACRHRGNKLVRSGVGCKNHFQCSFHGWVFSPEGKLTIITDEQQFDGVDKSQYGLNQITAEIWESFIFVNFDVSPREPLAEWLGEFYGQYGDGYFDGQEKVASYRFVMNCNWHLAVNSFTEGYHTMYLHKNTARDYQGGKSNPQRHRPAMELFRRHHRYSAPGNPDHRLLEAEGIAAKYGRKILPAFDFDMTGLPPGVNPARFDKWAFDVVEIFPNMVMLTGNTFRGELTFWPIDAGRTLVVNNAYNYRAKNLGERISRSYFRARGRDVLREDINTLEAQQQVLSAGAISHVVLSRQERALQHHYKVTADMMAAG